MKTYTDSNGHSWQFRVTYASLARARDELDLDLLNHPERYPADHWEKLVDLMALHLNDQIEAADMSAIDFALTLDGPTLAAATSAFADEYITFFEATQRPMGLALRQLWTQAQALETAALADLQALPATTGKKPGNWPALREFPILAPSKPGNSTRSPKAPAPNSSPPPPNAPAATAEKPSNGSPLAAAPSTT